MTDIPHICLPIMPQKLLSEHEMILKIMRCDVKQVTKKAYFLEGLCRKGEQRDTYLWVCSFLNEN